MKLVKKEVKTVYTLAEGIKVGDFIQLENTMSCDIIQCKLLNVDDKGVKIVKLSNMEIREYTYQQLENFEFKKLKLGIAAEPIKEYKEVSKEPIREDVMASNEMDEDEFAEIIRKRLSKVYGLDDKFRFYGM